MTTRVPAIEFDTIGEDGDYRDRFVDPWYG